MESKRTNRVDQWLDAALKQYGEADPRTGLEGRVLANLQTAGLPERRSWWPALVVVAAMVVGGAAIYLGGGHHAAKKEIATLQAPPNLPPQRPVTSVNEPTAMVPPPPRRVLPLARTEPRLERFPAPRPLTIQEQRLARYVQERPEEAKQVAQAQADLFRKDLAVFEKQYGPLDPPPNSSQ